MKYKSLIAASFAALFLYVAVFAQSPMTGTVTKNANLRAGPGTTYAVAGTVKAGDVVTIINKNKAGTWYQLDNSKWIAVFLVNTGTTTPQATPTQPNGTPQAPATSPSPTPTSARGTLVKIGEELHGNGWRFHVKEIHKRKAVYFYDNSYVAMGHFLVVIIDAVNEQSGTDHFNNNIKPYLVDDAGHAFLENWEATVNATWQFNGISTIYTNVNPGNLVRIAMAFDLPDNLNHVMLSTELPAWVDLGDFSKIKSEDN